MRILYVLNSGSMGGMERHTLDLARGMRDRGHEVFVWCKKGTLSSMFEECGAHVTNKSIGFDIDPIFILTLYRFLVSNKIDILHSHELKASVNSLLAGWFAETPVRITHTHTPISEWRISEFKKKLNTSIYSFLVNRFSSQEVALTDSRKFIKEKEGIKSEKMTVIPNGLDASIFEVGESQKKKYREAFISENGLVPEPFIFGNVSRITREKGHEVLVDAFDRFLNISLERQLDTSNVYLVIAGTGNLEEELKRKTKELGILDRVIFLGRFEESDLVNVHSLFDVFIFPSLAEGFGLVLIEAMASAKSIICSNLDVLQEVGGSTITYFETGNPQALAEKMYDLYVRFDRFEQLRKSTKERVQELYTLETFIDNHEVLYKELLDI